MNKHLIPYLLIALAIQPSLGLAMNSQQPDPSIIDISGLNKKEVLRALFRAAKPLGLGLLYYNPNDDISDEQAAKIMSGKGYIDYLAGRLMKINLTESTTMLDVYLFNRDNGEGAAQRAIAEIVRKASSSHASSSQ